MASALSHIVYTIWLSAEVIDLGQPYWILHPVSCHTPRAVTTVFKCFWGWTQKAPETCRVLLQLLINILPSYIKLVLYIYQYTFLIISHSILLRMRNFSDKNCRENFGLRIFSPENRAVYEMMWKKNCRTGQATDDNMAHALFMLDT